MIIHKILEFLKIPEAIYIPFFGWRWYKFITKLENLYIKRVNLPSCAVNNDKRREYIVVSLTTFPARINTVYYAIKSLMLQTCKPDRIILWLARDQFVGIKLPEKLLELKEKGLEIRYCEDYKSHKKYFVALKEQENELIVTYDDDLIYPSNSIELLLKYHKRFPSCIICNRGFKIGIDYKEKKFSNVKDWKILSDDGVKFPSNKIMPSTGGGCLYPPNSVSLYAFDWDLIRKTALTADDLWMKAMGVLKGTKVVKTTKYSKTLSLLSNSQSENLTTINDIQGQNEVIWKNILKTFPEVHNILTKD